MDKPTGYSYRVHSLGDSQWCQELAAPIWKEAADLVPFYDKELPEPMKVPGVVTNAFTSLAVIGVSFFVVKHLTGKFLDDVYAQFQPRVKAFLAKVEQKLNGGNRKAKKIFSVNVWYAEYDVLVSVAVVGRSFDEVVDQLKLVPSVHSRALNYIRTAGRQKPIHHYEIENGRVSPVPKLLDRISETMQPS
jgi:hypothetical protein